MRLGIRCGLWRSALGDTWPHDASVEMDWWPQGLHLVSEPTGLVLCAAGAGGGSRQPMFRSDLEPLLTRAHERWRQGHSASSPSAVELDRLFAAIQHELETNQEHAGADNFQASAVARAGRSGPSPRDGATSSCSRPGSATPA